MNREDLESLLTQGKPDIKDKNIYIWGTGNTAELYREGMHRLEKEGMQIKGYCDNDPNKWGQTFDGKQIISPKDLEKVTGRCVLICSPQGCVVTAVGKQLDTLKTQWYHIDEVIFKMHKDCVMACYDLLDDEESKNVYAEVIESRMEGRRPDLSILDKNQYFALRPFMGKNPKEVYVDCGAFVGDSVEKFIWERDGGFQKIIAFEPDPGNFAAMESRIDRLKREWNLQDEVIELYPYGVGENNVMGMLDRNAVNNGLGSKMKEIIGNKSNGSTLGKECRIVALDEFIKEPITFLKADIESYEYKMLLGAKEVIKKYQPLLAICIYHNAVDMYSIPLLLKSLVPKYKMAIRHHSVDADDTVLYAWTE